ncbi:hypothetical protein OH77DRAFT_1587000 [Trametes cingulata]|nr:hypothetical protein OH77DRAFT_1587000 [Trametes cingulata]
MEREITFPPPGTYALLRVDPAASVADVADPLASEAASHIVPKTYVAYLYKTTSSPQSEHPWRRYRAHILGPRTDVDHLAAGSRIPIHPNVPDEHSRASVHPSKPFPFPDYYHYVAAEVEVRVRTEMNADDINSAICLGPEDHAYLTECRAADAEAAMLAYEGTNDPDLLGGPPKERKAKLKAAYAAFKKTCSQMFAADRPAESEQVQVAAKAFDMDKYEELFMPLADEEVPVVDLAFHLGDGSTSDISGPEDFMKEAVVLRRIVLDARGRHFAQRSHCSRLGSRIKTAARKAQAAVKDCCETISNGVRTHAPHGTRDQQDVVVIYHEHYTYPSVASSAASSTSDAGDFLSTSAMLFCLEEAFD